MKANELMIGDWVCVTKNFTQKYHKIRALSNDEGAVLRGIYVNEYGVKNPSIFSPNDTEPIPLTLEILEKNGFEGYDSYATLDTEKYRVIYAFDGFLTIVDDNNQRKVSYLECDYVHQLQHAMRICGIEKTIEL